MINLRFAAYLVLIASSGVSAFTSPTTSTSTLLSTKLQMSGNNLVVISPPGGVGEVAAVQAAKMGSSVRWFVISPSSSSGVSLSGPVLDSIAASDKNGSIELAGAQADTLLVPNGEEGSAIAAVSAWCGPNAHSDAGVICVYDGVDEAITAMNSAMGAKPMDGGEIFKTKNAMMDAIKVAAKEATSGTSSGIKVAVLPFEMEFDDDESDDGPGLLGSLLGGNKVQVPNSLNAAMGSRNVATLRYGELFGTPESSPDASAFLGGPRKYPVLRDEYTMKAIRIDPTISVSGNTMMGDSSRSSRLSVGEAAVRMATKSVDISGNLDVCITSLSGMESPDDEDWAEDFARVQKAMKENGGAELFSVAFGSVPNLERLADWLATKWAPAVLKTYDIAGIRVGGRPVYASRVGSNGVEIVWQELKDFQTLFVGTMMIEVTNEGITASRGPGDASAGFGSVSKKPLAGEDILVRRLSDAAVQAIEKGLATKPAPIKRKRKVQKVAKVVSTVVSAGEVETPAPVAAAPKQTSDSGPRTSGARRSSERARGKRRTKSAKKSEEGFQ